MGSVGVCYDGSSIFGGVWPVDAGWSRCSVERDVAHYSPLVVVHVPVAAPSAFDLFDDPVESFGSGVGHS